MNNLPKVVAQQRHGRASNPRFLDCKSDAIPLSHHATKQRMYLFYTSADMFGGPTCSLYHNSLSYSLTICSLACGYITTEDWQIARLTFRPKPEQTDYMAAKSF